MRRRGEHIDRLHLRRRVAVLRENLHVARSKSSEQRRVSAQANAHNVGTATRRALLYQFTARGSREIAAGRLCLLKFIFYIAQRSSGFSL